MKEYKNTNLKIYDYMKKDNEQTESIALNYFGRQISYSELIEVVEKLAVSFKIIGIKKGEYVPICLPNVPQGVMSFYALNKIGAIPDMIPVLASKKEFEHYLSEVHSDNIIIFRDFYSKVKDIIRKSTIKRTIVISALTYIPDDILRKKINFREIIRTCNFNVQAIFSLKTKILSWDKLIRLSKGEQYVLTEKFDFDDTALLMHTGGTTGIPKSAEMTNENFNAMVEQYRFLTGIFDKGDKILAVLPMFINYGLCNNIHMPLSFGVETIIVPTLNPDEAYDLFSKYKPNHFMCVSHYFEYMMNDKRFDNMDLSFIKTITYGGAPLSQKSKNQFNEFLEKHGAKGIKILNGYGMTESTSSIAYEQKQTCSDDYKLLELPYSNIEIIEPETGRKVPNGQIGELCVEGPIIFKGYLNNEEETAKVLKMHDDGKKWLHSGDLAIMNNDRAIEIVGRLKRIYVTMDIINGNVAKIFPDNIENVIKTCECVKECAIDCKPNEERVNVPFAFLVLNKEYSHDKALKMIKEKCLELNAYSRPYNFIFLNELNKTAGGKVDYKILSEMIPENYTDSIEEIIYD